MTDPLIPSPYKDDDMVYVDPETRTVVGKVEWMKNEKPKSKPYVPVARTPDASPKAEVKKGKEGKDDRPRGFWRKNYPFGTYRSMKRIYKLEGKIKDAEPNLTLEEVLPHALKDAYWGNIRQANKDTSSGEQL